MKNSVDVNKLVWDNLIAGINEGMFNRMNQHK